MVIVMVNGVAHVYAGKALRQASSVIEQISIMGVRNVLVDSKIRHW